MNAFSLFGILLVYIPECKQQLDNYSQTCIKRSHLGQRKSGLLKQVIY